MKNYLCKFFVNVFNLYGGEKDIAQVPDPE